jgi:chromosome segregation ATPase
VSRIQTLPRNTCPKIDAVIDTLESAVSDAKKLLEEIRSANSDLREAAEEGQKMEEELDEARERIENLENQVAELKAEAAAHECAPAEPAALTPVPESRKETAAPQGEGEQVDE